MTEDDARGWITTTFGDAATERVALFLDRVVSENAAQNLISPTTMETIWHRHALDSAQLLTLAPAWRTWLDVGTGGGFPGMVVALLAPDRRVVMVEPRRRRADFLVASAAASALSNVEVFASKVEATSGEADVISARAVSSVENLLRAAGHWATGETQWLLPRGRSGRDEAEALSRKLRMFHVEHSLTDPQSIILSFKGRST